MKRLNILLLLTLLIVSCTQESLYETEQPHNKGELELKIDTHSQIATADESKLESITVLIYNNTSTNIEKSFVFKLSELDAIAQPDWSSKQTLILREIDDFLTPKDIYVIANYTVPEKAALNEIEVTDPLVPGNLVMSCFIDDESILDYYIKASLERLAAKIEVNIDANQFTKNYPGVTIDDISVQICNAANKSYLFVPSAPLNSYAEDAALSGSFKDNKWTQHSVPFYIYENQDKANKKTYLNIKVVCTLPGVNTPSTKVEYYYQAYINSVERNSYYTLDIEIVGKGDITPNSPIGMRSTSSGLKIKSL